MRILALDAATRTGYAVGEAGSKPLIGCVLLKKKGEPVEVAWANAGHFATDMIVEHKPDLVIIEAPMHPGIQGSGDAVVLQWGVVAVITFVCHSYGVRIESVNAQRISKHFVGKARWTKAEGGRKAKKAETVRRAKVLGYMPADSDNDDIADACASFDFATVYYARQAPRELVMF